MEITKADLKRIHDKFITDPDWKIVESLIEQFIEPLKSIDTIETSGKNADEVFAMVQGRKIAYESLRKFVDELRLVKIGVTKSDTKDSYE